MFHLTQKMVISETFFQANHCLEETELGTTKADMQPVNRKIL